MKLKLHSSPQAVLEISEALASRDWMILRAGIEKIIKNNCPHLVLDFAQVKKPSDCKSEISALRTWAVEQDFSLAIAGPTECGDVDALDAEAASQIFSAEYQELISKEADMKSQTEQLQKQKLNLEQELSALESNRERQLKLARDHSDLRGVCKDLEKRLDQLLKERNQNVSREINTDQSQRDVLLSNINQALDQALTQMHLIRNRSESP